MIKTKRILKFASKVLGAVILAGSLITMNAQAKVVPVYRMVGSVVAENFYTTDINEAMRATICYRYLGPAFYASDVQDATFDVPVYRLFNGIDHLYTTDIREGINLGYRYEMVAFYGSSNFNANNKMVPLYRFCNGLDHFYSTNMNEGYFFGYIGGGTRFAVQCAE